VDASERLRGLRCWSRATGPELSCAWQRRLIMTSEAQSLAHYKDEELMAAAAEVLRRTGELRLVVWLREVRQEPRDDTDTALRRQPGKRQTRRASLRSPDGLMPQRPVDSFHLSPPMQYDDDT
jgi:hypothetical protein